jgi:hypothetical protein
MKKIMSIMAALALISVSVQAAGPKVEMKTSGPSGQGNLIWWAPSSGITNLVMTTNGISVFNVATGAAVLTNATVSIETGAITATSAITKQTGAITATAIITPQLDTNGIMTNATCAVTIVGGDAVMTNATAAVTVVGGDAVVTNVVLSNP